ncbi:MAG: 16S rRNA (guanine(966)-N(2))-methyltransferase RsmD, partial [Eubacteriales bacterium]|nr:16S rRNA (guanine(966)-N(2))-methyltransferase RsmD [Eubacteriales bacterium]
MRVIAGKAKHLKLKTLEGQNTRPTTDRIKETLFNMISFHVEDSRFLDLFSGSGAIGIEALSRGAKRAVFVENNRRAAACIRENLKHTHLEESSVLLTRDVSSALSYLGEQGESFDIIFMDPPYGRLLEKEALLLIDRLSLCGEDGMVIVESDLETDFSYLGETRFHVIKEKKYKTNKHTFIG